MDNHAGRESEAAGRRSACVPVCPVAATFAQEDLPEQWHAYIEINKNYVDSGKFQPDKYQKPGS